MSTTNGQKPVSDPELISAFYDAETSAEELAAVQRLMAESNEPVQALEEYELLTLSLRELHRAKAAPDLRADVMSAVSSAGRGRELVASRSSVGTGNRRRLLQIAAGLAGLAAAVTLLLWPLAELPSGDAVVMNESEFSGESQLPPLVSSTNFDVGNNGTRRFVAEKAMAYRPAAPSDVEAELSSAADTAALEADIADSLEAIANERPLPEVGDVVGYLDRNADDLTWVAVTVVDVQEAGGQVQMLLARHGVESPAGVVPQAENVQQSNEQVAFVVEADWDQMEGFIVDLSEGFELVQVDAPNEEGVPPEFQNYASRREGDGVIADAGGSAESLRQRMQKREGDFALGAPADVDAKPTDSMRVVGRSVQLQANLPSVELQRIAAKRDLESLSEDSREAAAEGVPAPGSAVAKSRPVLRGAISARPRAKVLIVLEPK